MRTLIDALGRLDRRLLLVQMGVLLTFALIPVWYRFPGSPPPFTARYVTGFLILLPMLGTIIAWLAAGLPGFGALRRDRMRGLWALALLALAIWAYASRAWALERVSHPGVAENGALQLGVVALFALAAACAGPPARAVVAALVFSLAWDAAVAGLQVANQRAIGLKVLGEFPLSIDGQGISVIQAEGVRWLRPYGLLPHPNVLAGVFAISLPACLAWILSERRWMRRAGTALFLVGLWALLLTFSRAAWLGFTAGVFSMLPLLMVHDRRADLSTPPQFHLRWPSSAHIRPLIWPLLGAFVTAAVFFVMYRPLLLARAGVGEESLEQRSVSDRLVYAQFAFRSVAERPLLGVGIGNFPWRASHYLRGANFDLRGDNVHQVLLSALAELGLVGYGLVVAALAFGVEAVLRAIGRPSVRVIGESPPQSGVQQSGAADPPLPPSSQRERQARIALFGGFMALTFIGLLDHYPWTLIQFQVAWWGLLAAAIRGHE